MNAETPDEPIAPKPSLDRREMVRSLRTMLFLSAAVLKGGVGLGAAPQGDDGGGCGQPAPTPPGGYFEDAACKAGGRDEDCGKYDSKGQIYMDNDCTGYAQGDPNKDLDCGKLSPHPAHEIYYDNDCEPPQAPNPMPETSDKDCGMSTGYGSQSSDWDCGYVNNGIANHDNDCGGHPVDDLPPFPAHYGDSDCGKQKNAQGGKHTDNDCGKRVSYSGPAVFQDDDCTNTGADGDCGQPAIAGNNHTDSDCAQTGQDSANIGGDG